MSAAHSSKDLAKLFILFHFFPFFPLLILFLFSFNCRLFCANQDEQNLIASRAKKKRNTQDNEGKLYEVSGSQLTEWTTLILYFDCHIHILRLQIYFSYLKQNTLTIVGFLYISSDSMQTIKKQFLHPVETFLVFILL